MLKPVSDENGELERELAFSFCARSLVSRFSPSGVRVEVSCVGDKIGRGLDFQPAIDECVADQGSGDEPAPTGTEPNDTVVVVEGQLTGGPIVTGAAGGTIEAILENDLEFVLSIADGVVTGEGIVSRRIDGSNESCRHRYISPLGFTFVGTLSEEDASVASGTFDWRVVESKARQLELEPLGDDECAGFTSFAAGSGDWEATWDDDAGSFEGSLTIPGGLGTNTFKLAVTSVITSE
jgi:hypothetical protein